MPNRSSRFIAALAFMALVSGPATAAGDLSGPPSIRALISVTYDKSDAKVQTDPVVVVGDHAVADWIQGKRGGRALLRRDHGKWEIVVCAGEGLTHAETLEQAGVPPDAAKVMAQRLSQAEESLPTSRRHQFDLFGTANDPAPGEHAGHTDHSHEHHPEPKH